MAAKKKEVKKVASKKVVVKREIVKEVATAKKTSITDAQLKAAAEDLQVVVGPKPAINLKAERMQFEDEIKEVAGMLAEGDEIQAETAMVLKELGVVVLEGVKIKEEEGKEKENTKMVKKKDIGKEKKVVGKKAEHEVSCYGHRIGSNGAVLDKEINAGGTFDAIAKRAKVEASRLKGHIQHLRTEHKMTIAIDEKTGNVGIKK